MHRSDGGWCRLGARARGVEDGKVRVEWGKAGEGVMVQSDVHVLGRLGASSTRVSGCVSSCLWNWYEPSICRLRVCVARRGNARRRVYCRIVVDVCGSVDLSRKLRLSSGEEMHLRSTAFATHHERLHRLRVRPKSTCADAGSRETSDNERGRRRERARDNSMPNAPTPYT